MSCNSSEWRRKEKDRRKAFIQWTRNFLFQNHLISFSLPHSLYSELVSESSPLSINSNTKHLLCLPHFKKRLSPNYQQTLPSSPATFPKALQWSFLLPVTVPVSIAGSLQLTQCTPYLSSQLPRAEEHQGCGVVPRQAASPHLQNKSNPKSFSSGCLLWKFLPLSQSKLLWSLHGRQRIFKDSAAKHVW